MRTTDKKISLEAAQLLGVPFRWSWSVPLRFVVRDDGSMSTESYQDGRWAERPISEARSDDLLNMQALFSGTLPHLVEIGYDDE